MTKNKPETRAGEVAEAVHSNQTHEFAAALARSLAVEIDALAAELARVKADSLRVVPLTDSELKEDKRRWGGITSNYFVVGGTLYSHYNHESLCPTYSGWNVVKRKHESIANNNPPVWVRLETWEATHDNN